MFGLSLALAATAFASALPPPAEPLSKSTASPAPSAPPGSALPYGSPLLFVLDDKIDSGNIKPGTTIHMHLKDPIAVNGVTLAPAGTPATLAVIMARKAHSGDEDGAVQIHIDPLGLPGRDLALPVRAYHEYLTIERTAGAYSTRGVTDEIADIFIPGHFLYHALRPGQQMVLPPGSVLRAETDATVDARDPGHVVLSAPPPFVTTVDPPHADLTAAPLYTPAPERPRPLPKGKPTLPPTPEPTPKPTDEPTPGPSASA